MFDFIKALFLIFAAEMGDKTQFLAMAFATKYPVRKILMGVFIGSFLNHGLAIVFGRVLLQFMPQELINFVAGLMFIFFAFMSLKVEDEDIEEKTSKYGAVMTVALAFFIGELGDKTQLAALGLSIDSNKAFMTLLGTATGMVLTSALAILVGIKLGKNISEDKLKLVAFALFLVFGLEKLYNSYLVQWHIFILVAILLALLVAAVVSIRRFFVRYKAMVDTAFRRQAEALKKTRTQIVFKIDTLCKGIESCKTCDGAKCLVGYMRSVINQSDDKIEGQDAKKIALLKNKKFDKKEAIGVLEVLITYYDRYESEFDENIHLKALRRACEMIVYNEILDGYSYKAYKKRIHQNL